MPALTQDDYTNLLRFRTALRSFDAWSHEQARHVGLTHAQHQLLLAVKGHPDPRGPTIGEVADYLNIRHHSGVGLVDRTERLGLVDRRPDEADARAVRVHLTDAAETRIARLTAVHLTELARLAPILQHLVSPSADHADEHDRNTEATPDHTERRHLYGHRLASAALPICSRSA